MTLLIHPTDESLHLSEWRGAGISECSHSLQRELHEVRTAARLQTFYAGHALDSLTAVYMKSSEANWDGEDAIAVPRKAYLEAARFLQLLPSNFPTPEIAPDPSGEIGFEWRMGTTRVYLVTLQGMGIITYAGLFGASSETHGRELFMADIPSMIFDHLRRLVALEA